MMRRFFPGRSKKSMPVFASILLSMGVNTAAFADDIDVLTSGLGSTRPNILFVLDYSGSMADDIFGNDPGISGLPSRESILEAAVAAMLDQNEDRINAGLSLYQQTASGIKWPVSDPAAHANTIDSAIPLSDSLRSKDVINNILSNVSANNNTATVGALTEAALYFRGGNVSTGGIDATYPSAFAPEVWDTGLNRYNGGNYLSANPVTYSPTNAYVASPESWTTPTYNSPIALECQSNFIVLISDGQPTANDSHPDLASIIGRSSSSCEDLSTTIFDDSAIDIKDKGNCGPELVEALKNNDQRPNVADSKVRTFTVGFNVDGDGQDYLKLLATKGGGEFFKAEKPEDLTSALDDIILSILGGSENFSGLSIDVNKATFSNDNRVYFPLFRPSKSDAWRGNLKGYFIDSTGLIDTNNVTATVTDVNGTRFADSAQSFWSPEVDANDIDLGGASALLPDTTRTIYTYTDGSPTGTGDNLKRLDNTHLVDVGNSDLTTGMMGSGVDSAKREALINWLHTAKMGDPLHTRSVAVKYPSQTIAYITTNQGLLHAIDATKPLTVSPADHTGGNELFAFIPPDLLPNLSKLMENDTTGSHIYGLDGGMTRWHDDANNDGIVNGPDTVMLIFGMRRGGMNYYALDVTDPADPVYKWKIEGNSGSFAKLSQSWSKMALISVLRGGVKERVLAFGGGYDAGSNDGETDRKSGKGNAIYMIDRNGALIWEGSSGDMDYSIPSDLTVIDSNNDGIADRIYVGDLGGQIWRVDFGDVNSSSNFNITRLADIHDSDHQAFYYPPSVALNRTAGKSFISVAIGSGNRTDPLYASTLNKLYMIRDEDTEVGPPVSGISTTTHSHLYNATLDKVNSSTPAVAATAKANLQSARGWYVNLEAGEKVLSKLLTFEGKILATTYSPVSTGSTDPCVTSTSQGRYYAMSVIDASPVDPLSNETDPTHTLVTGDRRKVISTHGIPSEPIIVFPPDSGSVQVVVDKKTVSEIEQKLDRVMWHPK